MYNKNLEREMAILRAAMAKADCHDGGADSIRVTAKLEQIYGEIYAITELDPQGVVNSVYYGDVVSTTQIIKGIIAEISRSYNNLGLSSSLGDFLELILEGKIVPLRQRLEKIISMHKAPEGAQIVFCGHGRNDLVEIICSASTKTVKMAGKRLPVAYSLSS
ncbi:MAG: hypothetical protein KIG14_02660 [Candidatus Sacchiramonaceae bacterium]|nr:hypothetical protein [Candidatus Saccharimonadaceae bacterium]